MFDARASWGAALRTGAVGSQDESRCSAIHKQRPYQLKSEDGVRRDGAYDARSLILLIGIVRIHDDFPGVVGLFLPHDHEFAFHVA